MKTFLSFTAAVAFAALVLLPFAAEIAISTSFIAILALVFTADYGRQLNPLPLSGSGRHGAGATLLCGASNSGVSARERLRLAA